LKSRPPPQKITVLW